MNTEPTEKRKGIIQFPKDKIRCLETACHGNNRIGRLLDYFIYGANLEAERHGLEESCKVVTLIRKQKDIFEKLNFNISRKTFIGYIRLLNEWGYVSSEPYGKVFTVNGEAIQAALDTPPDEKSCSVVVKKPKVVDSEKVVLEQKVVELQQKVEVLEQKVVKLQHFVEEISTLQHGIRPLPESDEGHHFSPTSNYSNISNRTSSSIEPTDKPTASTLQENQSPLPVSQEENQSPYQEKEETQEPQPSEKQATKGKRSKKTSIPQNELSKLDEPILSEKAKAVWDVWLKMPWNKIVPKLTTIATGHCETLALVEFSEEILWKVVNYARKNDKNGFYDGRGIQLGDIVREYPKWSNEQITRDSHIISFPSESQRSAEVAPRPSFIVSEEKKQRNIERLRASVAAMATKE